MRTLILRTAVVAALVVAAAALQPRAAYAAPAPVVTSVVTGGDANLGDVTVTIYGTKLAAVKTVTLTDVTNTGNETITVLFKANDRIVVKIPSALTPGTYRFVLAPKKGDPVNVDYVVPSVRTEGGFFITDGNTISSQTITADLPTTTFSIGTGFASANGVNLAGVVTGKNDSGPQFRFNRTPSTDFVDIGMNPAGAFAVRNQFTTELFAVEQSGLVRVGAQSASTRFTVNGPQYAGFTAQIHAHPDDNGYLAISDGAADVFFVDSGGVTLAVGTAVKPGGGAWGTFSDARLKKDVVPLEGALDTLLALRSVSFEYKDPAAIHEAAGRHVGFVAQEVEKVLPAWVSERADGMKTVAPKGFESLTVAALRELRDEKDAQIRALAAENEKLRERLAAIEKSLGLAGAAEPR